MLLAGRVADVEVLDDSAVVVAVAVVVDSVGASSRSCCTSFTISSVDFCGAAVPDAAASAPIKNIFIMKKCFVPCFFIFLKPSRVYSCNY